MKENKTSEKERYKEVSPSAAVMIPLTVGLACLILTAIVIFALIFQPNETNVPEWGFLFLLLISIGGLYGVYDARSSVETLSNS